MDIRRHQIKAIRKCQLVTLQPSSIQNVSHLQNQLISVASSEGQWVCTPFIEEAEGGRRQRKMLTYNNGLVVKENIEDVPFADLTQLCPQEETLDRVDKNLSVFSAHLVKVSVSAAAARYTIGFFRAFRGPAPYYRPRKKIYV